MKNKGITLISLVITIIILIILASTTINMTLGENGIFKKAKEAKRVYEEVQANEIDMLNNLDLKYAYEAENNNNQNSQTTNKDIEDLNKQIEDLQNQINELNSNIFLNPKRKIDNQICVGAPWGTINFSIAGKNLNNMLLSQINKSNSLYYKNTSDFAEYNKGDEYISIQKTCLVTVEIETCTNGVSQRRIDLKVVNNAGEEQTYTIGRQTYNDTYMPQATLILNERDKVYPILNTYNASGASCCQSASVTIIRIL